MKTLSKKVTSYVFGSDDGFKRLQEHWSSLMNSDRKAECGPEHHALYLALLGKDYTKGFSPVTNERKLIDGGMKVHPMFSLDKVLQMIQSEYQVRILTMPFVIEETGEGLVNHKMIERLRPLIKAFSNKGDGFNTEAVEKLSAAMEALCGERRSA